MKRMSFGERRQLPVSPRRVASAGLLVGCLTGIAWPGYLALCSSDQVVDGTETLSSLVIPPLVAWCVFAVYPSVKIWQLVIAAYLTVGIPLFGISIGGAPLWGCALGGALGGGFWMGPWVIYAIVRKKRHFDLLRKE